MILTGVHAGEARATKIYSAQTSPPETDVMKNRTTQVNVVEQATGHI